MKMLSNSICCTVFMSVVKYRKKKKKKKKKKNTPCTCSVCIWLLLPWCLKFEDHFACVSSIFQKPAEFPLFAPVSFGSADCFIHGRRSAHEHTHSLCRTWHCSSNHVRRDVSCETGPSVHRLVEYLPSCCGAVSSPSWMSIRPEWFAQITWLL